MLRGLALYFVLVMTVVTMLVAVAGEAGLPLVLRLGVLAAILPPAMTLVARAILNPAALMDSETEQLRTLYSQARLDALLDPITGLGNHRAFQEELHRQVEDAGRHDHALSLAIIDVDDLKRVNDEHGHAGGDQLLSAVGRLLGSSIRAADRGFRIGGDEFAVLFPHADGSAAHAIMRRILAAAVAGESTFGRPLSFSGGVTAIPEPSVDGRRMLRDADAALYFAKRHGRTDVQLFDPERHGESGDPRTGAELADLVDQVIARRALSPVFQPIFDLSSGAPVGFEGLVRPAADSGFRDASVLFRAAELTERTVDLDMLAIETIVEGLDDVMGDAYLSINLSPRSIEIEQFQVAALVNALAVRSLAPGRIVLELTEREAIEDMDRLRTNLQACQAAGFRIAADDVGAGNAGLRLLSEIQFDVVKIDLSLVQGGVLRDSAVSVLRAIQDLAVRAGATVVAEGIESIEQLQVVRNLGIATGQGYLLAPPATELVGVVIDVEQLLESHEARRRALLEGLDRGHEARWAAG
ncbi:MAG TPA: bifunctional diguanylate cyclase/phosphodiesterase [Candidatus Angelobacter sp.]|nr:bifunctional diguanylate cyclase/phosphodiesterase [Candidatus Angelobacter sp.]